MPSPNKSVTTNFDYMEFVCPCCGCLCITPRFYSHMEKLQELRDRVGFPITVNSGYRCPTHNKEVGGVADSQHRIFATDIRPTEAGKDKLKLISTVAEELGFDGIGKYPTFVHLDMRGSRARWKG